MRCPWLHTSLALATLLVPLALLCPAVGHAGSGNEVCDNCINDDGDGLVDREDVLDCHPRANGGFAGVGNATLGKAVLKCHKGMAKAGLAFNNKRLKILHGCLDPAFACVQLQSDAGVCLEKVGAKCTQKLAAAAAAGDKMVAAVGKACGPAKVSYDDLKANTALGLDLEGADCADSGPTPTDVTTFAACIRADHEYRTNRILTEALPRARELLERLGYSPFVDFPGILPGTNGDGNNLGPLGKAAVKCNQGISKASLKVGSVTAKGFQKCLDLGVACLQVKDAAAACLDAARAKCRKISDKLQAPGTGALAKITAGADKACAGITQADLDAPAGLGFQSQTGRCENLGVPRFTTALAITCAGVQQLCEGKHMLTREIPRFDELLDLLDVSLPGNL